MTKPDIRIAIPVGDALRQTMRFPARRLGATCCRSLRRGGLGARPRAIGVRRFFSVCLTGTGSTAVRTAIVVSGSRDSRAFMSIHEIFEFFPREMIGKVGNRPEPLVPSASVASRRGGNSGKFERRPG
jgi:hypothetical protein